MSNNYFLVYSGHWDRDRGLDHGRLTLNSLDDGNLKIWMATSSTANRQTYHKQFQRYGCLPANNVTKTRKYHILTTPEDSRHVKGVEGNFYRIYPNVINTIQGTVRTACGIHRDANLPGSLGCVVLTDNRFKDFEQTIASLKTQGIKKIPLQVQYS